VTVVKWRSVLFAPANQPALVAKLPRSSPDVVVLDLEDAVPASNKADARAMAAAAIATLRDLDPRPLVAVRVNAVRTSWFNDDMATWCPSSSRSTTRARCTRRSWRTGPRRPRCS
jgi:citrate lyase subunit beta/citryl-CoA lyase